MNYKVNKEKCIGCGACAAVCPKGFKMAKDGKAEIVDQGHAEKCGGKEVCPMEAIEKSKK